MPVRARAEVARRGALPWWAGWRVVAMLIAAVMIGGTAGYVLIEGWSPWDAFYMTAITITTAGYREVHPMSRAGEAFTVVILFGGVGSFFYAFTLFMGLLAEGGLVEQRNQRRRARMLDHLANHFILCGFGRMGQIIAREFGRQRVPFVVIERDPERMQAAMDAGYLAVEADASNEDVLRRVRIATARGFIAAVSTDAENVYAVLTARLLRPDVFIIGRAETDDARTKLLRAGADRVISPYHIGGQHLAHTALRPAVVDFVQLATSSENLELSIEQVRIRNDSPLAGRTLVEAGLRQKYHVIAVGIQRADGTMEFNPPPDTAMRADDQLVVLGRLDDLRDLEAAAGQQGAARHDADDGTAH